MTLNIAVPSSASGGLSPISPIRIDCWENIKMLVSPIDSESSGVSSLDSEEAKHLKPIPQQRAEAINQDIQIYYNGRNVLDLYKNLETNSLNWKFQYSHLPERNNITMFWANRSLYNRLGPNGLTPVYTINKCECCDFQYTSDCPNSYLSETSLNLSTTTTSPMIFTTASNKKREYEIAKMTPFSTQLTSSNSTLAFNGQPITSYNNKIELANEQFCNQNNFNKVKVKEVFLKKTNVLPYNNTNFCNVKKFNNIIGTYKSACEMSQLASALVSANVNISPSNTPPLNTMLRYNNAIHQYNDSPTHKMKCNLPQIFSNSLPLPNSSSEDYLNNKNNILPNETTNKNKTLVTSSTNFYSLFNSSNTNSSTVYGFNANNKSCINSFKSISNDNNNNKSNDANVNPFAVTSQHYGRMYKYF